MAKPPISIDQAKREARKPAVASDEGDDTPETKGGAPGYILQQFEMKQSGLWHNNRSGGGTWLSGPFEIIAETRDAEGKGWALLIEWRDRDQAQHREMFSRAWLSGDGGEARSLLADGGLAMNSNFDARQLLTLYLAASASQARARCVSTIGWNHVGDSRVFVLPDGPIGQCGEDVVFQSRSREPSLFGQAGGLDLWKRSIAAPAVGNSRLVFCLSAAFAAPLLDCLGETGFCIHLRGKSRSGKTTALAMASSVYGGTAALGANGFVRQWRQTSSALEGVAAVHCDVLLPLDEISQIDPKELGEITYLLANGMGRGRADRSGSLRAQQRFRTLVLSTGEVSLAEINLLAGKRTLAGQEARFIDVSADVCGWGIFEELHGEVSPRAFAMKIAMALKECYGVAGRAFIEYLIQSLGDDAFLPQLRARVDGYQENLLAEFPGASGQVQSIARRFAMAAVAGDLAAGASITDWTEDEAFLAAQSCFQASVRDRGSLMAREDEQAVSQLRAFISKHGASRFDPWFEVPRDDALQSDTEKPPHEGPKTVNRAGWRRWVKVRSGTGNEWLYHLTPEGLKEALTGLDLLQAKKTLEAAGLLKPDKAGKYAHALNPPGHKRVRLYIIDPSIMADDTTPD